MQSSQNGIESVRQNSESEENILSFLNSMDSYVILMDSLSATLRQGWLELASARHSMGASRVNSTLFDLKSHHASTKLEVHEDDVCSGTQLPHFTLCKWAAYDDHERYSEDAKFEEDELLRSKSMSPRLLHQHISQNSELRERKAESGGTGSPVTADNQAEKERFKSLSMFGTLVSPMLRSTQLSFETALEKLVEISNVRASLLHAYDRVRKDQKTIK